MNDFYQSVRTCPFGRASVCARFVSVHVFWIEGIAYVFLIHACPFSARMCCRSASLFVLPLPLSAELHRRGGQTVISINHASPCMLMSQHR